MNQVSSPRFYGRKKGRPLSAIRRQLLDELLPKLQISTPENEEFNPNSLFPGQDVWLEIGFGGGEHLAAQAKQHPDIGFVGCEAYLNGISSLLSHVHNNALSNVRIYPDDVRPFLKRVTAESIEQIFILFPDPWPKKRHHKRRIICDEQVQELNRILKTEGLLVIATDDQDYVCAILEVMATFKGLELISHTQNPPEAWITTRYEKRAKRLGHTSNYLFYKKG